MRHHECQFGKGGTHENRPSGRLGLLWHALIASRGDTALLHGVLLALKVQM
jgi:hypothetical protein